MVVPGSAKAAYFGISSSLQAQFPNDEQFYGSSRRSVRHPRTVELTAVAGAQAAFRIGPEEHKLNLQIDGQHNALNGMAALTTLLALYPSLDKKTLIRSLADIKPAFGRGELINYEGRDFTLQLIKNPASFRQALHVLDIHKPTAVAVVINDNFADGRDVSWLWDVDFSRLGSVPKPILTGGLRAYDMANRLKYDEVSVAKSTPNPRALIDHLAASTNGGQSAIIYTTYTAMLPLRKLLGRLTKVEPI